MTKEQALKKACEHFGSSLDELGVTVKQKVLNAYADGLLGSFPEDSFFNKLAVALRKLWPPGNKDGKYPWRESAPDLAKRLEFIWRLRDLGDKYSIEDCLSTARQYLAQFGDNAKYMQIVKYFVVKQKKMIQADGTIKYINESKFADMLESSEMQASRNEWEEMLDETNYGEGRLV